MSGLAGSVRCSALNKAELARVWITGRKEGRKRKSSGPIYSFSMGHTEEKTESYVTGPAGNCGARQDTRGVSHQFPTCRSSIFGSPAKLNTILQNSSGSWVCSELQPNVYRSWTLGLMVMVLDSCSMVFQRKIVLQSLIGGDRRRNGATCCWWSDQIWWGCGGWWLSLRL